MHIFEINTFAYTNVTTYLSVLRTWSHARIVCIPGLLIRRAPYTFNVQMVGFEIVSKTIFPDTLYDD